jgi:hypothetical protein
MSVNGRNDPIARYLHHFANLSKRHGWVIHISSFVVDHSLGIGVATHLAIQRHSSHVIFHSYYAIELFDSGARR